MKAKPKKKSREEIADPHQAIYHFKIYLLNISPMIYRRFKVKGDTHIAQLHHLIQIIMG
jgi:Plasmid pRiA4b ORF-3-like protein